MSQPPPGPKSRLLNTHRILGQPLQWLPRWRERYGDPFRLPAMNGNVTLTARRDLVKAIFAASPDTYDPWGTQAVAGFAGPASLLVLTGQRHTRERKLLGAPFHGERLKRLGQVMGDTAREATTRAASAGTVELLDLTQEISLEIIIRAVFGVQQRERVDAFRLAIARFMDAANPMFFFFPVLQRRWFPPWRTYARRFAAFDAMLQEQIELRRADPGDDILSTMLEARYDDGEPMADADIRDELRTLLLAGHETTAITLAWCIECLGRDEALREAIVREVDALPNDPGAFAQNETLASVWKETLRLHPVVTEALRIVKTPMVLGDYVVPAGEGVAACISLVHFDPELYPDPERFDPSRFRERRYGPTEFFPFGGGHRRCLGAAFAAYELEIVLGVWLQGFSFTLRDAQPPRTVRRNVTLAPEGGVPVRIEPRPARHVAAAG